LCESFGITIIINTIITAIAIIIITNITPSVLS
jgi:hypothetical protein